MHMIPMPVLHLPPLTPQPQARGPSHRTTAENNQRLRKKVRRFQYELKRARSHGGMPMPKSSKVNIGWKVTEQTTQNRKKRPYSVIQSGWRHLPPGRHKPPTKSYSRPSWSIWMKT